MTTMKVAVAVYPPYVYPCAGSSLLRTNDCQFPGMDTEIAGKVLEILNITYQIAFFNASNIDWGTFKNGSDKGKPFSGLLGLLHDGVVDMISVEYLRVEPRTMHFLFSFPFRMSRYYFVTRKSEISLASKAQLVFRTFSPALWGTIVAALIFLAMTMFFSEKILIFSRGENIPSFRRTLWEFYRFTLNQDHGESPGRKLSLSAGLIFVFLSFFSVVTVSMYQGSLLSRLLVKSETIPFKSLEKLVDLVETGRFKFIQEPGTSIFFNKALNPDNHFFEKIGAAIKMNPPLFENDISETIRLLRTENYIFPTFDAVAETLIQNNCDLTAFTGQELEIAFPGFVFRKGMGRFAQRFSETLVEIFPFIKATLEPRYEKYLGSSCMTEQNLDQVPQRALSVESLTGLFLLLLSAVTLSWMVLAVEIASSIKRVQQFLSGQIW